MDRLRVRLGRDDERRARVEDGGAALEAEVLPVSSHRVHRAHPEAVVRRVRDRDERRGVELCRVEPAERDLAVVLVVRQPRDLVGRDRVADEARLRERLDWGQNALVRERLVTGVEREGGSRFSLTRA